MADYIIIECLNYSYWNLNKAEATVVAESQHSQHSTAFALLLYVILLPRCVWVWFLNWYFSCIIIYNIVQHKQYAWINTQLNWTLAIFYVYLFFLSCGCVVYTTAFGEFVSATNLNPNCCYNIVYIFSIFVHTTHSTHLSQLCRL